MQSMKRAIHYAERYMGFTPTPTDESLQPVIPTKSPRRQESASSPSSAQRQILCRSPRRPPWNDGIGYTRGVGLVATTEPANYPEWQLQNQEEKGDEPKECY
jgi:hypothetical protein